MLLLFVIPPEGWAAINTFGLAVIALIGFLNNRRVAEVVGQVKEVKQIVDGPLSVALQANADLAARVAHLSGDHTDLKVAIESAAINQNRIEGKASQALPGTGIPLPIKPPSPTMPTTSSHTPL